MHKVLGNMGWPKETRLMWLAGRGKVLIQNTGECTASSHGRRLGFESGGGTILRSEQKKI